MGVGDDLSGVQALTDGFDEVVSALVRNGRTDDSRLGFDAAFGIGHDASVAGCRNHGDIDTLFHRFDAGPATGPLLAGGVDDLIEDLTAVFIVFGEDVGGDADEEALEFPLVPFVEDLGNGGIVVATDVFEQ